jgi:hypothetical protein
MLDISNPTTFKYYLHFIILYGLIFLVALALSFYKTRIDKRDKIRKRIVQGLKSAFYQASIYGFIFLGARYIRVAFLSMELLHILNLFILSIITGYYTYRIKYGYKKKS